MDVKIKEFQKRVVDAVAELRALLGATRMDVSVRIDDYVKDCRVDVSFFTSSPEVYSPPAPGCLK